MFNPKRLIPLFLTLIALLMALYGQRTILAAPATQDDACLFFGETIEGPGHYSVCNDTDANFRQAFEQWGLQKVGYPISRRYMRDGFVTQAFQKAIMQWRPESNSVALVNVFDELHDMGFDDVLFETRQTPRQFPPGWDGDLSFEEIIQRRQALLDVRPALRTVYFASDNPLLFFGLPTSEVEDMGNHYAVRLQRAVLQEWKEDVPWASMGEVTIANGGSIARELNALPPNALIPDGGTIIGPPVAEPTSTPASSSTTDTCSGSDWDFEGEYVAWHNPHGEDCPGGALAGGWNAFLTAGEFGSSCFNENKFGPNIQSGSRSQEITFESITGTAGLWRSFSTSPGKRYRVSAWGIWHESPSPVILQLGIDPSGGTQWDSASVQWNAWSDPTPGTWHQTTIEFVATYSQAALFLKGSHPIGVTNDPHPLRGGATLFDNVTIVGVR